MKVSEHIREFLLKNPHLFAGYTKFLNITTKVMVYSLDHFIRHSAIVKGVDLEDPWKETREYLERNFDTMKDKEFFIPTYMEAVYNQIKDPAISKEDFYKITNLSNLNDHICKCNSCVDKSSTRKVIKKTTKKRVTNKETKPKTVAKKATRKKAATTSTKGRARINGDLAKAIKLK